MTDPFDWEAEFEDVFHANYKSVDDAAKAFSSFISRLLVNEKNAAYYRGKRDGESIASRQVDIAIRKERLAIQRVIKTKMKNDPYNPVLIAGLEYALIVLKGRSNYTK